MKVRTILRNDILQLFFVILSFLLMVAVSYYFTSGIVDAQVFRNAQGAVDTAEANIRSDLREAEVALHYAGLISERALARGESVEEIRSYLLMIAEELSVEGKRVPGLLHVYGYFFNRYFIGLDWEQKEDYVPEEREWYKTAVAAAGGVGVTSPYSDEVTGKTVISLAKILRGSNGETLGIVVLDLDFSYLSGYVQSLHFAQGGYGMLCDENFTFIAHTFTGVVNTPMEEVNPEYDKIIDKLKANPQEISAQRITNRRGVPVVVIFRRIFNGWYLGIATPVSSYFREVNYMATMLSVLSVTFIIILSFILIRLSISKARSDEENMEKSSFLARMSHEIRTPMNSILGMAELIQRKTFSGEIKEYIEIIHQSGNNLLTIINDILDFSKLESGRLRIQKRDYDIASVINDMINMVRPRIAEKSLEFFVNVDSGIPARLYGDDIRLRQILTNLLSNAVKYTRRGFISLDVGIERVDGATLKLNCTVADSGIGIKDEDKSRLFKEFSRVEIKANQGIEGTGLGLAITRALCKSMDGDVTFTSEYAKGSVFRAVITQEYKSDVPVAAVRNPETKRVLFYDWRPLYVQSISDTLKSLKVDFKCASGFQEFIRELEHGQYEFAFVSSKYAMDSIYIPGMRDTPLELVIMVEPGEISLFREITCILMPVYSITVANVLNNETDGILLHNKKSLIGFTAPQAKVLIVDDITTNLRVAKELMTPYGMTIHTCLSGTEALELLKRARYDLVFMDHMMPGIDGVKTTALIRDLYSEDGYYRNLPVIALTANAISGQREYFLQNGINDFLAKPIDIQKLDEILEKWLPAGKRVSAALAGSPDAKEEKAETVIIPGVDTVLGLRNCGGGVPVYFNILADFCNDAETRMLQVADAFYRREAATYTTLVHALKGAALSIGAVETGEKAFWLEKASALGDDAFAALEDKTNELLDNIRALIGNIRAAAEKRESGDSNEYEEISTIRLEVLKTALAEMDIEAVNRMLLSFTGLSLSAGTKAAIAEVEQHILMFEYEKAIEKIDSLF